MYLRIIGLGGCLVFLVSCATTNSQVKFFSQPQINALVVSGRFKEAAEVFQTHKSAYGPRNELLYLLDKAYVFQMAGDYQRSIRVFEQAKRKLDELYTRSISNMATTWLVNDHRSPYRGEYFEHTLINVLQALNYAVLGDFSEALVEMRDVDRKLNVLNDVFRYNRYDVYREDALARFLSGILYESSFHRQDINDAFIAYHKALKIYRDGFHHRSGVDVPMILVKNLLATAQYLGFSEFFDIHSQFPDTKFFSIEEKRQKGEIYLIHYNGLSPLKHAITIPLPLPGGYITQLAFPTYDERFFVLKSSRLIAVDQSNKMYEVSTELAANVEGLAKESLNDRKFQLYSKAVLRPIGKYILERGIEQKIEGRHGDTAEAVFKGVSNIYNLFSEQADLRSWETLPAQIRIAQLFVPPGTYAVHVDFFDVDNQVLETYEIDEVTIKAGEKRFFIVRTVQ